MCSLLEALFKDATWILQFFLICYCVLLQCVHSNCLSKANGNYGRNLRKNELYISAFELKGQTPNHISETNTRSSAVIRFTKPTISSTLQRRTKYEPKEKPNKIIWKL